MLISTMRLSTFSDSCSFHTALEDMMAGTRSSDSPELIQVQVFQTGKGLHRLRIASHATVAELKQQLQLITNATSDPETDNTCQLSFLGRVLPRNDTLHECGVRINATLVFASEPYFVQSVTVQLWCGGPGVSYFTTFDIDCARGTVQVTTIRDLKVVMEKKSDVPPDHQIYLQKGGQLPNDEYLARLEPVLVLFPRPVSRRIPRTRSELGPKLRTDNQGLLAIPRPTRNDKTTATDPTAVLRARYYPLHASRTWAGSVKLTDIHTMRSIVLPRRRITAAATLEKVMQRSSAEPIQ